MITQKNTTLRPNVITLTRVTFKVASATVAASLVAMSMSHADQRQPYTVDDLLKLEKFGNASFSNDGKRLFFEKCGSYQEQSAFDMGYLLGETCSKIHSYSIGSTHPPKQLFPQSPERGYRQLAQSSDGEWILFTENSRDGYRLGRVRANGRQVKYFDFPIPNISYEEPVAVGNSVFVTRSALTGPATDFTLGLRRTQATLFAKQHDTFDGSQPSVAVIGSGAHLVREPEHHVFQSVDVRTGRSRIAFEGEARQVLVSPNGEYMARLRSVASNIDTENRLDLSGGAASSTLSLIVSPFDNPVEEIGGCKDCDVLARSVTWSPNSSKIAFFARPIGKAWEDGAYFVFDVSSGTSHQVNLGEAVPAFEFVLGTRVLSPRWVNDVLVIKAYPSEAMDRVDWFKVVNGVGENVTRVLASSPDVLMGASGAGLALISSGQLWHVSLSGEAECLVCDDEINAVDWRRGPPFGGSGVVDEGPQTIFAVKAQSTTGDKIVFAGDGFSSVALPENTTRITAISALGRSVAVEAKEGNVTTLMVLHPDAAPKEVATINQHLENVDGSRPVAIRHLSVEGEPRTSWLLPPAGYQPGDQAPTVVSVYPGRVGRETFSAAQMDFVTGLNDYVLSGAGFAVLYPSLPIDYATLPRDPLIGLSDEVDQALDAAIAEGFVDPQRIVLFGHSFGGFAAAGILGQTDRYKAAVSLAGVYNLTSVYGVFDIRQRMSHEFDGIDMTYVHISETGQNGMGAPPWVDPDRYLRNSPLMSVDKVETPVMLITGDLDYIPTTQTEEYFTALTRLGKDAVMVRYWGEEHVNASPPNIRDMWARILFWYRDHISEINE